jgi:isopenicillin-N epimerase
VHPLITTWGDKSGITSEFIWQGTMDYSPFLCIPGCIKLFNWLESSIQRNNMLAKWATGMLCRVWKTKPLVDESMQAAMITILVPSAQECHDSCSRSILHDDLLKHYGIQVPVFAFRSQQYMRISIAIYNTKTELLHLAYSVLRCLLYPLDYEGYSLLETYK